MIILYIGNVGYPDTAPSIHVRNRAIFMKSCGHEVHVLCELASDGKRMKEVDEFTKCLTNRPEFTIFFV